MQLQAALAKYQVQLEADGRSIHTRRQYDRHVRLLDSWLSSQGHSNEMEGIDHETLAVFLASDEARMRPDGKPKKATAMNGLRSSLRTFFAYCDAAGLVNGNCARLLRRARTGCPPPRGLSDAEQARLLEALKNDDGPAARRDRVLFSLMLATGIRIGSALAIEVGDVDLEAGEIVLGRCKADRRERVFIPRSVRLLLAEWVDEVGSGPLFRGRDARPLSARHCQRRFRRWCDRAGITSAATTHYLRHSFAMRLYRRTRDLALVQRALTHRSITSTLVYARADDGALREAVGV